MLQEVITGGALEACGTPYSSLVMSGVNVQDYTMRQACLDGRTGVLPLSKFVAMFNEVIYFWPSAP